MTPHLRLGVNIDHVATIRNARGGRHPDPVRAAELAVRAGADGITAHLREDRRHISDDDIVRLRREVDAPLNLEMAATDEMLRIALRHQPHAVCLVPERREERTTEGGLDAVGRRRPPRTLRRPARRRRHPRDAVRRAGDRADRGGGGAGRARRRAAHRRLVPRRATSGARRSSPASRRPPAAPMPSGSSATPATASATTTSVRSPPSRKSSSSTSATS